MSQPKDKDVILRAAANDGDPDKVSEMIQHGADVNAVNQHGNTALHLASYYGHQQVVATLVEADSNLDICNENGQTSLQLASVRGHINVVQVLTSGGADLNHITGHSNMTALHYASKEGQSDICQLLLDSGADQDIPDLIGKKPLYYAANQNTAIVFQKSQKTNEQAKDIKRTPSPIIQPDTMETETNEAPPDINNSDSEPDAYKPELNSSETNLPKTELDDQKQLKPKKKQNLKVTDHRKQEHGKLKHGEHDLNRDKSFHWSKQFIARQKMSVFDRLLGKK